MAQAGAFFSVFVISFRSGVRDGYKGRAKPGPGARRRHPTNPTERFGVLLETEGLRSPGATVSA